MILKLTAIPVIVAPVGIVAVKAFVTPAAFPSGIVTLIAPDETLKFCAGLVVLMKFTAPVVALQIT